MSAPDQAGLRPTDTERVPADTEAGSDELGVDMTAEVSSSADSAGRVRARRVFGLRGHFWPVIVLLIAVLVVWARPVLGDFAHLRLSNPGDSESFAFYLSWNAHALFTAADPFFTPNLYAPDGLELGNAISIPSVSLVVLPVAVLWGGTAAYNVAFLLAIFAAAVCMYLFAREVSRSIIGGVIAGLLMVISPYIVGHALGHLNLMWVFGTPLIGYIVARYLRGAIRPRWIILWTALTVGFTGGASTELVVTQTIFLLLGFAVAAVFLPTGPRARLARAFGWVALGAVIGVIALVPVALAAMRAGVPIEPSNPAWAFSTDLTNLIVPDRMVRWGSEPFAGVRTNWTGNPAENTGFLGIPLLVLLVGLGVRGRGRLLSGLAVFAGVALLLSLGPILHIAGVPTIELPWKVAESIPGLDHALPGRFSYFVFVAVLLIVAVGWSHRWLPRAVIGVLVVLSVLTMVPSTAALAFPTRAIDSAFASGGGVAEVVEPGDNVLVLPPAQWGPGMRWIDEADFSFTMPTGNGGGANPPDALRDPVAGALWNSDFEFDWAGQLEAYLRREQVDVVIVDTGTARLKWSAAVTSALGTPDRRIDGASIWFIDAR